jgi:hypothetical protein
MSGLPEGLFLQGLLLALKDKFHAEDDGSKESAQYGGCSLVSQRSKQLAIIGQAAELGKRKV